MTHIPPIQSFEEFERATEEIIRPPFHSRFGAKTWADAFKESEPYRWLVKGIIPMREAVLIYGAPQTGKSFETQNLALHIARGMPFHGNRVSQAGVVYCAFEGGKGFVNRQRAYALHHDLGPKDDIDMVVLTRRADLFSNDTDISDLIAEIKHWAGTFKTPLGLVVLDTWSAATPGANENASEDVSKIKSRVMRIVEECQTAVIVVHHKPAAGGRPRGHGSLTGDFETTIDIDWKMQSGGGPRLPDERVQDADGRPARVATITKQREGEHGLSWSFVLRQVETGRDEDGDRITSCVSVEPAGGINQEPETVGAKKPRATEDGRVFLPKNLELAMRALNEALKRGGRPAPDHARVPDGVMCVSLTQWRDEWGRIAKDEDDDEASLKERIKTARKRAVEKLLPAGFIGKDGDWVWRTSKRVFDVDYPLAPKEPAVRSPEEIDTSELEF